MALRSIRSPFPPSDDVMELAPSAGGTLNVSFLAKLPSGEQVVCVFAGPADPDLVLRWVTIWEESNLHVAEGSRCGALSGVQEGDLLEQDCKGDTCFFSLVLCDAILFLPVVVGGLDLRVALRKGRGRFHFFGNGPAEHAAASPAVAHLRGCQLVVPVAPGFAGLLAPGGSVAFVDAGAP